MVGGGRQGVVKRLVLLACGAAASCAVSVAQVPGVPAPAARSISLVVLFGGGNPQSHPPLTKFWGGGPAASAFLLVGVQRSMAIGIGLDAVLLPFHETAFLTAFPGVRPEPKNVAMVNLYMLSRIALRPGARFSPYIGITVGAARLTGAAQKRVIDGVRVTYYDIPGRTRLAAGAAGGVYYYIVRGFALEAEAKATYLHNDPEAGLFLLLRGGIRLSL